MKSSNGDDEDEEEVVVSPNGDNNKLSSICNCCCCWVNAFENEVEFEIGNNGVEVKSNSFEYEEVFKNEVISVTSKRKVKKKRKRS